MIEDIWAVMLKEWREFLAGSGGGTGRGRGIIGLLLIVGVVSILVPIELGHAFLTSPLPVVLDGLYLPVIILLNTIADSFAGERERHTLETLLASRLSDRAILFGKVGASVALGWALAILAALLQAIVANFSQGKNGAGAGIGPGFYPAGAVLAIIVLSFLTALLAASAGCLISLRATSTRQAQTTLGVGFMVLVFVPILLLQLLPSQAQDAIIAAFTSAGAASIFAGAVLVLLIIDAILLLITLARFQRSRLILS